MDRIIKAIADADKVLVGIGKEAEYDYNKALHESGISDESDYYRMYAAKKHLGSDYAIYKEFYDKLNQLLEGKDYYVMSLCQDDIIYDAFSDKVVTPCGGYRNLQPDVPFEEGDNIIPITNQVDMLISSIEKNGTYEESDIPTVNGVRLVPNNIGAENYVEEGYFESFADYKKWLTTTINKKLCILELGVDLRYPSVIRFPFDKTAYYNQKAVFFRINNSVYQHTAENKEKGISIKDNPIHFILG